MKKILIADSSEHIIKDTAFLSSTYEVQVARSGPDCLALAETFQPDLLIMDMMLPIMHGIEVLGKLKEKGFSGGIIMTSYQMMVQNYRAAIEAGCDYYLIKPFTQKELEELVTTYFKGTLKPAPFHLKLPQDPVSCYTPHPSHQTHYLRFWGTRGSNPVAGSDYVRYGGNTCSLEIRSGEDVVIIDAGTGIRKLGDTLGDVKRVHLFIGHTHWDHITGFPFFAPLYRNDCEIIVHAPVGFEKSAKQLFNEMLAYAYFPVRLDEMHSKLLFEELRDEQPVKVGEMTIHAHYTVHPGPTFGFRIDTRDNSIGYITDNELLMGYLGHPREITRDHPLLEPHLPLLSLVEECDTIIHEAQYMPEEYPHKIGWGHSSVSNACAFMQHTKCIDWIITHHDPTHSDLMLQEKTRLHQDILLELDVHIRPQLAYDGLILPL